MVDSTNKGMRTEQRIAVIGLGFVGLPLAMAFWRNGYDVLGIDTDETKLTRLRRGETYINGITDDEVEEMTRSPLFQVAQSFSTVASADAIVVCVPTPLNKEKLPDLSAVMSACSAVGPYLRAGQLFVLESSTYPGTTENEIIPVLEKTGMKAGDDFYVAYSPERIDPGSELELEEIPKVIGGINQASLDRATQLYSRVFGKLVPVSSVQAAELTKLVENTQRFINISLMNQLTILCEELGVSIWEVIDAASTKPYGFTPYYPGPGIGGHCIPVDPLYLQWLAAQHGHKLGLIDAAEQVNDGMPAYVVSRILKLVEPKSARILVVGVTYKPNINDLRESAAVEVLRQLLTLGVDVDYVDPFVPELVIGNQVLHSQLIDSQTIHQYNLVVILTAHREIAYDVIETNAQMVLDTQNCITEAPGVKVVKL